MKKFGILGLAAAGMMISGSAFALDSSIEAMSKAGNHQFYVWCTGAEDKVETAQGANADEAQAAIAGNNPVTCWPVWQGLAE